MGLKGKMSAPMEFTDEEKKEFRKNFNLFDKKRTGAIPIADMGTVLRSLGQNPTEAELQALMEEEEIKNAFLTFDADGSGFITREELIETLTTMGDPVDEETITGMIQEADVDGDGKINYEEFTKIMLES